MSLSAVEIAEEREHALRVQRSLRTIQERADDAFSPWDFRASSPVLGCDPDTYRRDLLIKAKRLLPGDNELRHVQIRQLPRDALGQFEDLIYPAAKAEAYNATSVSPGDMRKVVETDSNGMKMIRWVGQRSTNSCCRGGWPKFATRPSSRAPFCELAFASHAEA
jgi:hypothetical protein